MRTQFTAERDTYIPVRPLGHLHYIPLFFTGDIVELLGGGKTLTGDWEPGGMTCLASFLRAAAKLEFCPPEAGELIETLDACVKFSRKPGKKYLCLSLFTRSNFVASNSLLMYGM